MKKKQGFGFAAYILMTIALLFTVCVCVSVGSVKIPLQNTVRILWNFLLGKGTPAGIKGSQVAIITKSRLPHMLCALLTGACLSLSGAAMQGLLKNPLADGSTLGVSGGASLGAVLALAFGDSLPAFFSGFGVAGMAILFAFFSLALVIALSYRLDASLSTNTIILLGVVFSMFVSSLLSLILTFVNSDRLRQITFWTMGSLSSCGYDDALLLLVAFCAFGSGIFVCASALNAFAVGEDTARHIGVNVKRTKLILLICSGGLIGACVSVGGTIGFVGLVTPHIVRLIVGPNHKKLLPASAFGGAIFVCFANLAANTLASPAVLPIGVITSFIGAIVFVFIFARSRRKHHA